MNGLPKIWDIFKVKFRSCNFAAPLQVQLKLVFIRLITPTIHFV